MKRNAMQLLFGASLLLAAGAAQAHGDAPLPARHGGVVSEAASGNTAELSTAGGMLMVYLGNHEGVAIPSQNSTGEVTLLDGSKKQTLTLAPSGDNSLMAQGSYTAGPGTKALLKLTRPGQNAEMYRFVLP